MFNFLRDCRESCLHAHLNKKPPFVQYLSAVTATATVSNLENNPEHSHSHLSFGLALIDLQQGCHGSSNQVACCIWQPEN